MKQRTVGDILKDERLAHRFSLLELAKRTRIRQEYLEALESNLFEKLPATTFVKGYIRNYAQLFDFDPQPVLAILRRDYKESSKGKLVPREFLSPILKKRRRNRPLRLAVLTIGLIFCTVLLYIFVQWWQSQQPPELIVTAPQQLEAVGPAMIVTGETELDVRLLVNGQPVAIQPDGGFEYELIFQSEGLKSLEIQAVDDKERTTTVVRQVQVSF